MESWKWIKGYEGLYQISNSGRIKSYHSDNKGRILSTKRNSGYASVVLVAHNGKHTTRKIHILVADAFIGNIKPGHHVHHKDENKQNNHYSNLEIMPCAKHRSLHPPKTDRMIYYNTCIRPRPIKQFTLDGQFLAEYSNAKIASKITGVCSRNILQVASKTPFNAKGNIRKQAGGYIWRFADESEVVPCEG